MLATKVNMKMLMTNFAFLVGLTIALVKIVWRTLRTEICRTVLHSDEAGIASAKITFQLSIEVERAIVGRVLLLR